MMKLEKEKAMFLLFRKIGVISIFVFTLVGCNGNKSGQTVMDGANKEKGKINATTDIRQLTVTIDESALAYEDLKIHLSNNVDYSYEKAPFGTVRVSIEDLPVSVAELRNLKLPDGMTDIHQSPYLCPLLLVAAINVMGTDKNEAKAMINYIAKGVDSENRDGKQYHFPNSKGAADYYASDWSQLNQYKTFDKVRSYLDGATYGNSFWPANKPYTMTMEINNYSYTSDWDYVQLWITSTQLSSKKGIGIWKVDNDMDGKFEYYFPSSFLQLAHSLASY